MSQKEKMHSGDLYLPMDESIMAEQLQCLENRVIVKNQERADIEMSALSDRRQTRSLRA